MEAKKNNLGFLYFVCDGITKISLDYWLTVPEFVDRISYMVSNKVQIDKRIVFEVMRGLYIDYEQTRDYTGRDSRFNFRMARRGIESLWKSISGTKEGWRDA